LSRLARSPKPEFAVIGLLALGLICVAAPITLLVWLLMQL
jgi:hypothetical protein